MLPIHISAVYAPETYQCICEIKENWSPFGVRSNILFLFYFYLFTFILFFFPAAVKNKQYPFHENIFSCSILGLNVEKVRNRKRERETKSNGSGYNESTWNSRENKILLFVKMRKRIEKKNC